MARTQWLRLLSMSGEGTNGELSWREAERSVFDSCFRLNPEMLITARLQFELPWPMIRIAYGTVPGFVQSESMIPTVRSTSTLPPWGPTRLLWTTAL